MFLKRFINDCYVGINLTAKGLEGTEVINCIICWRVWLWPVTYAWDEGLGHIPSTFPAYMSSIVVKISVYFIWLLFGIEWLKLRTILPFA